MIITSGLHIDQAPPMRIPFQFFATAPAFMIIAGLCMAWWHGDMLLTPLVSESVTLVHLTVLGWLSMVMLGAMYQMIPVLAGIRVPLLKWATWVYAMFVIGVVSILAQIGFSLHRWFLLTASIGLLVAIVMFFIPIAIALVRTPAKHPTVVAMRMAILSLAAAMSMGQIFLGEYAHGFLDLDRSAMVGIHLTWGLLGWVATLIIGVSFQVLPMFYMMPVFPTLAAGWILTGIGVTLLALLAALYWGTLGLALVAGIPGLLAVVYYGVEILKLVGQRKRKIVDATFRFWQFGLICGAASLAVLALWPLMDGEWSRYLFGALFMYGFAGSIVLGMLYKIIPFLVWFHRFSRLVGLADVPMMDDLVPEWSLKWHPILHMAMVACLVGAAVSYQHLLFIPAGLLLVVSGGLVAWLIFFALRPKPPEVAQAMDFNSFFKDMPKPGEMKDG
ncbi:MAG: hypothetical protein HQL55_15360 [Magnetococcales bacterium]|nr:hypothetical protein [Magnetococcales bacterium]